MIYLWIKIIQINLLNCLLKNIVMTNLM
jgi:hypothetical protein